MKIAVKAVPDAEPNADGVWITVELFTLYERYGLSIAKMVQNFATVEAAALPLLPPAHHMVAYSLPSDGRKLSA